LRSERRIFKRIGKESILHYNCERNISQPWIVKKGGYIVWFAYTETEAIRVKRILENGFALTRDRVFQ